MTGCRGRHRPGGDDRLGRHRPTADPAGGDRARDSPRASSRPRTSGSSPRPIGEATCRSCIRSPGARRLCSRWRSGSGSSANGWGRPGSPESRRFSLGSLPSSARGVSCGPPAAGRATPAVAFALATGVMIASYSAVDRVGSRIVEPWLYAGLIWAFCMVFLWGWVALSERLGGAAAAAVAADSPPLNVRRAAVGGWITLAAYLLILVAFSVAPLTAVAPLRESAIVLASGWGTLQTRRGREPERGGAANRGIGARRGRSDPARPRRLSSIRGRRRTLRFSAICPPHEHTSGTSRHTLTGRASAANRSSGRA